MMVGSMTGRRRMIAVIGLLLVVGGGAVACLQDFDTFEGPAVAEEVDAGREGSAAPVDAGRPPEAAACTTAPLNCLNDRTACREQCAGDAAVCVIRCPERSLERCPACRDALQACNGGCNLKCVECGGACQQGCN
jgi:hypothetical protein